jgi:hypothetical protein
MVNNRCPGFLETQDSSLHYTAGSTGPLKSDKKLKTTETERFPKK